MPADLEISITGVDRLDAKFGRLQSVRILAPPMHRAVFRLQRQMATYPPPPAKSKYRRTGTYGRLWTTRVESVGDGLVGTVGIRLQYVPWVGSSAFQAAIHRGRWTTDRLAIQREKPRIVRDFKAEIRGALR